MHLAVKALLNSLSFGNTPSEHSSKEGSSTVGRLAQVYEVARNALEYRADHLVRRAAIERILRRKLIFIKKTEQLSEELLIELKWAMYMTEVEEETIRKDEIQKILDKYIKELENGKLNKDWLLGLVSAEIEERFNPNVDYQRFTTFAFNYLKPRVTLGEKENLDLVLFVAIDRMYSQSDEQQVSYHIYKLVQAQGYGFLEAWESYRQAMQSPGLNKLTAYIRRQMGPLVLLRDIYFARPTAFAELVPDKSTFYKMASETLGVQLQIMSKRIKTASLRSLMYVFLTKVLITLVVEVPLERLLTQQVSYVTLGVNMLVPVIVMMILTATARLPKPNEQEKLIGKSWSVIADFDADPNPWEMFPSIDRSSKISKYIFTALYGLLFLGIFAGLMRLLTLVGYNFMNLIVFLFFLSVVSFFAFRIRQTSQVYSYRVKGMGGNSLTDVVMLPIVVAGGWLSTGVSKLNFLVFVFDFVLEAPFKLILKFLDNWMAYLSARKDDAVG